MRKNRIIDKNWSIENIKYGKYKSNVPGDITNDLYLAGRIDDPLFGVNFKDSRWILESPWDYSVSFGVDERDYGIGASIIREMGIKHMRLMTNNPLKRAGLEGYGLQIDEIVPVVIAPNEHNLRYLKTKEERMHHTLGLDKK